MLFLSQKKLHCRLSMLIMSCGCLCVFGKLHNGPHTGPTGPSSSIFPLSSLSPLFPYLLSPGVRTSLWPLRTQRPGETWMTPTPHPLWAPRDRPVGDTSPRVETTPVNWVRASADLLCPLFISKLWLSCDLFLRHGHCWWHGGFFDECS